MLNLSKNIKTLSTISQGMEEKILSMYAKDITTGDIESHMKELYDIDISDGTISRIMDKILPIEKECQERPLKEVYAVVFMVAIHYYAHSEGKGLIVKPVVYIALRIDRNKKRCTWNICRRKRKCKILIINYEWT